MTQDAIDPTVVCDDDPLYQFSALLASVPERDRDQVLNDLRLIAATGQLPPP